MRVSVELFGLVHLLDCDHGRSLPSDALVSVGETILRLSGLTPPNFRWGQVRESRAPSDLARARELLDKYQCEFISMLRSERDVEVGDGP